ncbi:MAG: hypothetical protein E7B02_11160, partial [Streptococcus salivarius]|nr:hypothetical protein [Streptococcus salivarius]
AVSGILLPAGDHRYGGMDHEPAAGEQRLRLLVLKEMSTEFYNLDFLSLPYDVNIDVKEVVEDVDLTVYKNSKYREFNFFKNICK